MEKNYVELLNELRVEPSILKEDGLDILLEYSETQGCFHFNYLDKEGNPTDMISPNFFPIGYVNENTYGLFRSYCSQFEDGDNWASFNEVKSWFKEFQNNF